MANKAVHIMAFAQCHNIVYSPIKTAHSHKKSDIARRNLKNDYHYQKYLHLLGNICPWSLRGKNVKIVVFMVNKEGTEFFKKTIAIVNF